MSHILGEHYGSMALSTDYAIRTGAYDPPKASIEYRETTDTGRSSSEVLTTIFVNICVPERME